MLPPKLNIWPSDQYRLDRLEIAHKVYCASFDLAIRKHHDTNSGDLCIQPTYNTKKKLSVGLIITLGKMFQTVRVTMYLQNTKSSWSVRWKKMNYAMRFPSNPFRCADPAFRGPKNGLIVSYERLSGCYLRESAFLDLIRSGYIDGYSVTTKHLKTLIEAVLKSNRAVVAAIQSAVKLE